ncbi:MAG: hypothetical protein IH586_16450, partial [Anaerolineaceae bacterium]|nr:hypothetical protein [Anaerolineaceae bacterium]
MSFKQLTHKVLAWKEIPWKEIFGKGIDWKGILGKVASGKAIPGKVTRWIFPFLALVLILSGIFLLLGKGQQGILFTGVNQTRQNYFFPLVYKGEPPGLQTLHEISNYDADGNFPVIWETDPLRQASAYILEEAKCTTVCDEFKNPKIVYSGADTIWMKRSKAKTGGTFLYRVRAKNSLGYSKYSNIKIVTIVPAPSAAFSAAINKMNTPKKLSDFGKRWATRNERLDFSGVWRFRELLNFCEDKYKVSIGEGQTILQQNDAVAKYVDMADGRLYLQYEGLN